MVERDMVGEEVELGVVEGCIGLGEAVVRDDDVEVDVVVGVEVDVVVDKGEKLGEVEFEEEFWEGLVFGVRVIRGGAEGGGGEVS